MYTVAHVTDNTIHEAHISDFVAMGCDCYAKMRRIKCADTVSHNAWQAVVDEAEALLATAQTQHSLWNGLAVVCFGNTKSK